MTSTTATGTYASHIVSPEEFSSLWEAIIVDQQIKDSLLCQAILNFTLRPKVDRAVVPLQAGLECVRDASADPDADLMGPIVAALDADATIGEITGCLREGLGLPGDPFEFAVRRQPPGIRT